MAMSDWAQVNAKLKEHGQAIEKLSALVDMLRSPVQLSEPSTVQLISGQAYNPTRAPSPLPVRVNNSQRACIACPRKWFLRYGLGATPDVKAATLRFGTFWSQVMDAYWGKPGEVYGDLVRASSFILKAIAENQDPNVVEELDLANRMLRCYDERYRDDGWEVLGVELELEMPIEGGVWYGTLDKLARDKDGMLWVIDHKSTAHDPITWRDKHPHLPQLPSYALLAKANGYDVVGWCWDIAAKKAEAEVHQFDVIQSGKRLSKVLPVGATVRGLQRALDMHGFPVDDWAQSKLDELNGRPDQFFRREWQRIELLDSDRWMEELEAVAALVGYYQDTLIDNCEQRQGEDWRTWAERQNENNGTLFPRQAELCMAFNRACEMLPACKFGRFDGFTHMEETSDRPVKDNEGE